MERGLRLIAVGAFADEMRMALPEFKLWNSPQHYVATDEVVWKRGSSLVVLGTDPKGERDAISVSAGVLDESGEAMLEMLGSGLVNVTPANCGEVAQQLMELLCQAQIDA